MYRLHNNTLAKALHLALYDRLVNFANVYTPELESEKHVAVWLQRFYLDDDSIHILVELDDNYKIISHCFIVVEQFYNDKIVYCYQLQSDKKDRSFLLECIEYARKLKNEINAKTIMFFASGNIKAYEKLGFKAIRHVMIDYEENIDV